MAVSLAFTGHAAADEILFLNGDRLTGKIVSADGGKLTIKTETAGVVTVDLAKVKTFSTDEPIVIKTGDTTLSSKVTGSSSATTRLRRPERRRKMYAISSASAGRSDRWHANPEDAR